MYSLNNIIKYNKYKVAHQIRLVCPETQLAKITRKIWNPKIWGFLHQKALYGKISTNYENRKWSLDQD
jgi:hypothetical protein